jgi:hypothetical protein
MNEVNILEEKPKMKGGFKVLLVILILLILVAGGVGAYFYFKKSTSSPKAIYAKMIGDFGTSLVNAIDSAEEFKNLNSGSVEITGNISTTTSDLKDIAEVINKLKLKVDYEMNEEQKAINSKVVINYNDKEALSPNVYIRGNDIFVEDSSIYSKAIKITEEKINVVWQSADLKSVKVMIEELTKIAKDNLSEDYFAKESVSDTLNKITLTLNKKNLERYTKAILNDIKDNNKIINEIVRITDEDKNTIIKNIDDIISEIDIKDDVKMLVETYINKKNNDIKKVVFDIAGLKIILDKKDDVKYDIELSMAGQKLTIGSLIVKDNLFSLNIDVDGLKAEYTVSSAKESSEMTLSIEMSDLKAKLKQTGNEEKGTMIISINYSGLDATLNFDYSAKKATVDAKAITDYVESDKLTEEESNEIMNNISKNENMIELLTALSKLSKKDIA